jgi:spore coat protein U-like protein
MNKYIIGLIALVGILAIFTLNLQPVSAWSGSTTATATVNGAIDVTLTYSSGSGIDFGNLNAGTSNNSATNHLTITINPVTNVATDISQNASGAFSDGNGHTFPVGNLWYEESGTELATSPSMTTSYNTPFIDWSNIAPTGSTQTRDTYYWLSIPANQVAGTYSTTINIQVSQHY